MDIEFHTMNALFAQLGLADDDDSISQFIKEHRLDKDMRIDQADFWSANKAKFLRDSITEDSDWAGVVDQLDKRLRK